MPHFARILASLFLLTWTGFAKANEPTTNPTLAGDWLFSVGVAFTETDPRIGLAPDGERVDLIDLDSLGVDPDDDDFYFSATWQAPERWRVAFTAYTANVTGGVFTDRDYEYGDIEIPAGSGIAVDLDSRFYILNAHYAIWQKPRWEAGVGVGVYALDWSGGLSLVEGGEGEVLTRESEDFLAPLPTLGLFARYAFTSRLAGRAGVDWLSLTIGDYDGEVLALNAGLDWWFTERWGLSAGISIVELDVVVDDEPFNQYLDANWDSLYLKLNLAF